MYVISSGKWPRARPYRFVSYIFVPHCPTPPAKEGPVCSCGRPTSRPAERTRGTRIPSTRRVLVISLFMIRSGWRSRTRDTPGIFNLFTGDGGLYIFFIYTLGYANGVLTWEGREWTRSNTV